MRLTPCWVKKGLFEYKSALALILLTFLHTKLMKFKPTFVQTFNKVVELNKSFVLFHTILSHS